MFPHITYKNYAALYKVLIMRPEDKQCLVMWRFEKESCASLR